MTSPRVLGDVYLSDKDQSGSPKINPLTLTLLAFWLFCGIWFNRPLAQLQPNSGPFDQHLDISGDNKSEIQMTSVTHSTSYEFAAGFPFAYQTANFDSESKLTASDFRPLNLAANLFVILVTLASLAYAFSGIKFQLSSIFAFIAIVAIALALIRMIDNSRYGYFLAHNFTHLLTNLFLSPILFTLIRFCSRTCVHTARSSHGD